MQWLPVAGAFVGAVLGVIAVLGGFIAWEALIQRKEARKTLAQSSTQASSLDAILEKHLEEYIVEHFSELFPGWNILAHTETSLTGPILKHRRSGVRYRTEAGEIDILCKDELGDFVVIELKRNKAPDRVVAQVDRYISWVKQNLAQPDQVVRGLIVARSVDRRLPYILSERDYLEVLLYDWRLHLNREIAEGK